MLRKMTQKFRNYKSSKFNINLIILHISFEEEQLVCWSWFQSCLQGVRAQVQIPVHLVLSQLIDTRFFRLKKLDFSLVLSFPCRTTRSGLGFKTLQIILFDACECQNLGYSIYQVTTFFFIYYLMHVDAKTLD